MTASGMANTAALARMESNFFMEGPGIQGCKAAILAAFVTSAKTAPLTLAGDIKLCYNGSCRAELITQLAGSLLSSLHGANKHPLDAIVLH